MTSALRGERGVTQCVSNTIDRLRECVTKGGWGQKSQNFCGRHFSIAPALHKMSRGEDGTAGGGDVLKRLMKFLGEGGIGGGERGGGWSDIRAASA